MKRKQFTTTIRPDLLKDVKKLAIDLDRPVNTLLEEGIRWLLDRQEVHIFAEEQAPYKAISEKNTPRKAKKKDSS